MRRSVVIGLPLVMLLAGGGAGWWMRDEPTTNTTTAAIDAGLEPPLRPLPAAPNPAVIDIGSIIGLDRSESQLVGPDSALSLPLAVGATATVVGANSFQPAPALDAVPTPAIAAVPPQNVDALNPLDAPPSTLRPTVNSTVDFVVPTGDRPTFVDPCVATPEQCSGVRGVVTDDTAGADEAALDPLQVSLPFAAAAGFAELCSACLLYTSPSPRD